MNRRKFSNEILSQFKAVQRKDKRWAIDLGRNQFLHWIEAVNDSPVTISNADLTMQSWVFKEEAEGIIDWLKRRWSLDPKITADVGESIKVTVDLDFFDDQKNDKEVG